MTDEPRSQEQPADTLRRAAELMRKRAKGASTAPWEKVVNGFEVEVIAERSLFWVASVGCDETGQAHRDAEHIAALHPGVALLIADQWEATAEAVEMWDGTAYWSIAERAALAAARAYLGEPS